MRLERTEYYFEIAKVVAQRSTCSRLSVGAIAVLDKRIIATGYNGNVAGEPHCVHSDGERNCTNVVHAEENIVCQCAKFGTSLNNAIVYCTHQPCAHCIKLLKNAGVLRAYYLHPYGIKNEDEFIQMMI